MIGIELFSGAGGMSLGATMAGIDVKLSIDKDKFSSITYKVNHPNTLILNDDIRNLTSVPIDRNEDLILFGGPPCQGFSKSNHRTRNSLNNDNWLFLEFIRIAEAIQPKWIVFENVKGLIGTAKGIFFKQIIDRFKEIGYTISFDILNAMYFGVPQNRERLFIVGSLDGVNFKFPSPSSNHFITVKEAIVDLPSLPNGSNDIDLPYKRDISSEYSKKMRGIAEFCTNNGVSKNTELTIKRYSHIGQGKNWQEIPPDLMFTYKDFSRCHTGIYHRLNENLPSVIIGNYRKNMLIHPWEDRGLSVREAARLQSFPDWFKFFGPLGSQQQQVGNAVPPLLAKRLFDEIMRY